MRTVGEVMEPELFCLALDTPLACAAAELAERGISGAPVCDPRGRVVGMLTKSDLVEVFGAPRDGRVAADIMTPMTLSVVADDPLERAIGLMAFEGVHRLLVVDALGNPRGIITSMDVLRELAGYGRTEARIMAVAPPPTASQAER